VTYQNPGDGFGTFVPVLMPGKVYNTILNVQNTAFQMANKLAPGNPLFQAVILRSPTPINFTALQQPGFRYLDYEGFPLPTQAEMQLQGGALSVILQNIETFALQAVQDVGQFVTNALGTLEALFAGRINYNMTIGAQNLNSSFASSTMTRAWGASAGQQLGAAGLKVTILQNFLAIFPLTFSGTTDDQGNVNPRPASNGNNVLTGAGFCVNLTNSAVWATSFLMPNEVCNLQGFDRVIVAVDAAVSSNPVNIPDFSHDQNVPLVLGDEQLNVVYSATDSFKYMTDVAGYTPPTGHMLVGDNANIVGSFHDGRAFTYGLHLRNESDAQLENLLSPYINSLGNALLLDQISTGGSLVTGAAGGIGIALSWFVSTLANNDIIMPDASIAGNREVGSHEYGHYILLSILHDQDPNAIDDLIGDTITSGQGSNNNFSTRYLNESFADFITGQVVSAANYRWLTGQDDHKFCVRSPCFDNNFADPVSTTNTGDTEGIARGAALLHDGFDGQVFSFQPNAQRNINQPDNADTWNDTAGNPPYVYVSAPYGNSDGPDPVNGLVPACRIGTGPQNVPAGADAGAPVTCVGSESVAMPGSSLVDFGHNLANIASASAPYLTDQKWNAALDQTMVDAGYNWCQRCQVLALHTPENGGAAPDKLGPMQLLSLCWHGSGPTTGEDANLAAWHLPSLPVSQSAPDPGLRLDASTCQTCPPNKFPDANGRCTVDCPADLVIDGSTAPLANIVTETTFSSLTADTCPSEFVLEVDHPDQFFARGVPDITAVISVDTVSAQNCVQPFTLGFADEPPTGGFTVEQSLNTMGTLVPPSPPLIPAACGNVPSITLESGQLKFGSDPIRFTSTVTPGVSLALDLPVPITPPK
jgi:hypothetical protein